MKSSLRGRSRLQIVLVLAISGALAACGPESSFRDRKDAGAADHAMETGADTTPDGDGPGVDAPDQVDGGAADGDNGDGGAVDANDAGMDTPAGDAADVAPGIDGGGDGADGDGGGDVLPAFVRVWTFDQASLGIDGWGTSFGLAGSTLMYDGAVGSPTPGSLLVNVPFSDPNGGQQYAFQGTLASANLTGRHVSARIRLESGGPAQGRVGFSTTSSYVLVMSPPVPLTPGVWTTVTLDVDNLPPGSFVDMSHLNADGGVIAPMPSDTRVITVVVSTPYLPGTYTPAVFHVDTVGYY